MATFKLVNGTTITIPDTEQPTSQDTEPAPYIDVRLFGAVGDGATDDTLAIQNAIDSLPLCVIDGTPLNYTNGGGRILLSGKHFITAPIRISHNMTIEGKGDSTSLIVNTAINAIEIEYKYADVVGDGSVINVKINDIKIEGNGVGLEAITNANGRYITNGNFKNITIFGFKAGLHLYGGWMNLFENIIVKESVIGFLLNRNDALSSSPNANTFIKCSAFWCYRIGFLVIGYATNNKFIGCQCETILRNTVTTPEYAPWTDPTGLWTGVAVGMLMAGRCRNNSFDTCYFENIGDTDGTTNTYNGIGILLDGRGNFYSSNISYNEQNNSVNCFFNSTMTNAIDFAECKNSKSEHDYLFGTFHRVRTGALAISVEDQINPPNLDAGAVCAYEAFKIDNKKYVAIPQVMQGKEINTILDEKDWIYDFGLGLEEYRLETRYSSPPRKLNHYCMNKFGGSYSSTDATALFYLFEKSDTISNDGQGMATIGMPNNVGTFSIPSGTASSYQVIPANKKIADKAVIMVNLCSAPSGITNWWVERNGFDRFTIHFTGTTSAIVKCSYFFIQSNIDADLLKP